MTSVRTSAVLGAVGGAIRGILPSRNRTTAVTGARVDLGNVATSVVRHPLFIELVDTAAEYNKKQVSTASATVPATGPGILTRAVRGLALWGVTIVASAAAGSYLATTRNEKVAAARSMVKETGVQVVKRVPDPVRKRLPDSRQPEPHLAGADA
jgi:hypothetical protein